MIKMHSVTYAALCSPAVRAIRYKRPEGNKNCTLPHLHNQPVLVDDREPRNELVELVCLAIQENDQ